MQSIDLRKLDVNKLVDAIEANGCCYPLLETRRVMTSVPIGGVLETRSSDLSTKQDIEAWARKTGQEFLGVISDPRYDRIFVKRVK